MIVSNDKNVGYTTKYINKSSDLYNYKLLSDEDLLLFYKYINDICYLMNNLHSNGVAIGDFHFENVLLKDDEVYLIDLDNICIGDMNSYSPSYLLYSFCKRYDIPLTFKEINSNSDKLSLLLSVLQMFIEEDTIDLSLKEVSEDKEKYLLVRLIVKELEKVIKEKRIYDIPFVSEMLCLKKRP